VPGTRERTDSAAPSTHGVCPSKKRSSFVGKWLKTVWTATSAAAAMSAIVTASKPRSANRACAVSRMSVRVCAFFRARRSITSLTV
jgi:hypothetical protein